jgi:hypothetical protein
MIRKSILAALVAVVCAGSAWAQHPAIELNFYADYLWTSSVSATVPDPDGNFIPGELDIKNNPAFGFALDVEVRPGGTQIELLYERQASEMEFLPNTVGSSTEPLGDITTSYYHIGAIQGFRRGNVMPFTGGTIGATSLDPSQENVDTDWMFSFAFHAGAKVYLSERIGLRFHGRLFASFLDASAGLYYGSNGAGMTITGGTLWQWALGGGLIVSL